MRRKSCKMGRLRLSPNEEAQLVKEELDRRRKLRLQQVREQERYIAQQVRREVQERREKQLQILADTLQDDWQLKQTDKLQTLARSYEDSLQSVGHAHRRAQDNEPDLEALAQRRMERQERAADRHRVALLELTARRHEQEEQRLRHTEARRKALLEEKRRALRVASLPPPPNPLEGIGMKTRLPLKPAPAERFSVTHHHMPATAVDRETDTEQMDARQAAEEELQRLEELQQVDSRDRLEKLEKARLRGNHALKKEQDTQDYTRLLCELQHLQQADLLRRRRAVNRIPAQIFQPLYKQEELRDEQQQDLEIAFHNMHTEQRKVKGDLVLQLVPEPLPHPSAGGHDEDLDVTLDPEEEEPDRGTETLGDPGRHALRRLLDRIRNQRDGAQRQQTAAVEPTSAEGDDVQDVSSIETGSLSSQEREQAGSVEEQTPSVTQVAEVSDEAIVAGTVPLPEEQAHATPTSAERERKECFNHPTDEVVLLRQQREQLVLLEELEEKRRELEQRLKEAQLERRVLEDAAQVHSGMVEVKLLPEPPAKVTAGDAHTQRLHQYQQRLLEQNRQHKKCVEDARGRLEEFQRTLKLRHAIDMKTAAQTLQQSAVSLLHLPNDRTPDHQSGIAHPDVIISPKQQQPERDTRQTCMQSLFSPELVSSDVIGSSVQQSEVSVQSSGEEDSEVMSHDARVEDHPSVCVSEREQVLLPPPSVVLELLRSRQRRAAWAEVCTSVTPSSEPAGTIQIPARHVTPPLQREAEPDQPFVQPDRREGRGMSSSALRADDLTFMNTLLRHIEESSGHMEPPAAPCQSTTLLPLLNDSAYEQQAPVNRGKVKPPVSRPSARLAFLQQMEPHELSAIQEVDTPVNISLDAEVSGSSSVSLPAVVSDGSQSVSERSQVTGRLSRMSWREALLMESSASSVNHQLECGVAVAPDRSSVDTDSLSSTTISTGSYSTNEHEPNCSITDASLFKPVAVESSVFDLPPKSTSCRSQEMRDSIQQIIDKYTKDLDTSLRSASVHTGGNTSSVSLSWSSTLKHDLPHDEDVSVHGRSAFDMFNAELTGDFIPLQPHPDIDSSSSSSSSSKNLVWNETVNQIIKRYDHYNRGPLTEESSPMRISQSSCNSASLQPHKSNISSSSITDQTASHGQLESHESVLSQQIGRVSDMDSSQVLDESRAPLQQTPSTGGGGVSIRSECVCGVGPSVHLSASENMNTFTEATCDDTSDCFLSLPTEVTHNESLEYSLAARIPLEAETCRMSISACPPDTSTSDWLEPTDASLSSNSLEALPDQLRAETPNQSKSDPQMSMEHLSLNCDSFCESGVMALPTAADLNSMKYSPFRICPEDESHDLASQEVGFKAHLEMSQHMSGEENMLDRLLNRIQEVGDVKGILEESTVSFISLPESTLQDSDIIGTEECTESAAEADNRPTKENETQEESNLSRRTVGKLRAKQ